MEWVLCVQFRSARARREVPPLVVVPEPLAPMVVPLGLVSVAAVLPEEVLGVVVLLAAASLLGVPAGAVVPGAAAGGVVVSAVLLGAAPAAPEVALEPEVPLLGVCAMDQPPIAKAAMAASALNVFLGMLISLLLDGTEGT